MYFGKSYVFPLSRVYLFKCYYFMKMCTSIVIIITINVSVTPYTKHAALCHRSNIKIVYAKCTVFAWRIK